MGLEVKMTRKILFMVSEWGYWGEELIGPLDVVLEKGWQPVFMTNKGKKPPALGVSMEPGFFDVPLDKVVVDEYYANRTREVDDSAILDNPINLSEWFPERPYFAKANFAHNLEAYHNKRTEVWKDLEQYDALVMPGGSGAMVDMANNQRLHDVLFGFMKQEKPIVALCYAVTVLAFARDWTDRRSIIRGKHVTGHAMEYDYKDGTGFAVSDLNFGPPFYPLEAILRDSVQPDGEYHGGVGHTTSSTVDFPFICGRSTQDSRLCGELLVDVLENGMTRYGW
jgi:putative intracellular protease/amidase